MIRLCVKEMAQDRGMSQAQLRYKSGLGKTSISNYWNNRARRISLDVLEILGEALGVSGTNLLTDLPLPKETKKFPHS